MSAEIETLDQLLGGPLSLATIRGLYSDDRAFLSGVLGLVSSGDACLVTTHGAQVPRWRLRELFVNGAAINSLGEFNLRITDQGVHRVG